MNRIVRAFGRAIRHLGLWLAGFAYRLDPSQGMSASGPEGGSPFARAGVLPEISRAATGPSPSPTPQPREVSTVPALPLDLGPSAETDDGSNDTRYLTSSEAALVDVISQLSGDLPTPRTPAEMLEIMDLADPTDKGSDD